MTTRPRPNRSTHLAFAGLCASAWLVTVSGMAVAEDAKPAPTSTEAKTSSDSAAAARENAASPSSIKMVTPDPSTVKSAVPAKAGAPGAVKTAAPAHAAPSSAAKTTATAKSAAGVANTATPANAVPSSAPKTAAPAPTGPVGAPKSTAPANAAPNVAKADAGKAKAVTSVTTTAATPTPARTTTASPAPKAAVAAGSGAAKVDPTKLAKPAEPVAQEERITYQYNALGRRDPFKALIDGPFVGVDEGANAPPDVGGIQVVGIVWGADDKFAMVEDPRGNSLVLRRGDKVMNGVVEGLKRDAVIVKLTTDGQTQSVEIPLTRKGDNHDSH